MRTITRQSERNAITDLSGHNYDELAFHLLYDSISTGLENMNSIDFNSAQLYAPTLTFTNSTAYEPSDSPGKFEKKS